MIDANETAHYVSCLWDLSNKYPSAAIPFLLKKAALELGTSLATDTGFVCRRASCSVRGLRDGEKTSKRKKGLSQDHIQGGGETEIRAGLSPASLFGGVCFVKRMASSGRPMNDCTALVH